MITFEGVAYKNFLAAGNANVDIKLTGSPMTLIVGTNGSGKSTMLDVLCFVLFNRPFRNFNKGDVVNSINKKNCVGEVFFRTPIGKYVVRRGVSPALFEILKDNEKIQITGATELQSYLEKVLGFDFKTFTQVVILGSASFVPFMRMKAAERRVMIEELLDIKVFGAMNDLVKSKLTTLKNALVETESNVRVKHQRLESLMQMTDLMMKQRNQYQQELDAALQRRDAACVLVETLELQCKNLPNQETQAFTQKLQEYNIVKGQMRAKIDSLVKENEFLTKHEDCPTCKQVIAKDYRELKVQDNQVKVTQLAFGLVKLDTAIQRLKKDIENATKQKDLNTRKLNEWNGAKNNAKYAQDEVARATQRLGQVSPVEDMAHQIALAEEEHRTATILVGQLTDDQRYYLAAQQFLKDNGIKARIIKQYLPIINKTVNDYLKEFDFFIGIEFDEQFNEKIKARHRDVFTYEHFSEGERSRIDLALLLTWRHIGKLKARMDTNLLIMDEIMDSSLDEAGIGSLISILEKVYADRNTFIISHRGDVLADLFDNVIKFEKHQGFSRIAA